MDNFGQMVKNRRKQRGMSTRELSSQIQMSSAYVSQLERGLVKRPSYEVAKRIADVLDIAESALDHFGFVPEILDKTIQYESQSEIEHRKEMEKTYRVNLAQQLELMDLESLEAVSFLLNQQMDTVWRLYELHKAGNRQMLGTVGEFLEFIHKKVTS